MIIEIQHESQFTPLPADQAIENWVEAALRGRVPDETEICIRLVDKQEIQSLNKSPEPTPAQF